MEERLVDAERIIREMEKENQLSIAEELIKDNQIVFNYKDHKYRVRLLNLVEKEELDLLRRAKFGQLMKDTNIMFEKDIIVQYKARGMDIGEIDGQVDRLIAEDNAIQLKLGEAISKNEPENILKNYEEQIIDLRRKKQVLTTQKNLLLELSFENAILAYVAQVITYLSLEKYEDDKWVRTFHNIDDFQNYSDEGLINQSAMYSMMLQYS